MSAFKTGQPGSRLRKHAMERNREKRGGVEAIEGMRVCKMGRRRDAVFFDSK